MRIDWLDHAAIVLGSVAFAASISLGVGQTNGSHPPDQPVTISYAIAAQQVTLHEPVILAFNVTNGSSEPIKLNLGEDRKGGFSFILTTPDGVKRQLPTYISEGVSALGTFSIQPGESYSQNLLLNEWYGFSEIGKYELEGHLADPLVIGIGVGYRRDAGFRATLEIGPRDELALAKTCEALANQIDASNSYQQSADATLALSYVKDPIAVPYLRRALLSKKLVEPLATKGLEQIANEAAVRVLIGVLSIDYAETAVLSRSALVRIRNQTRDPELRQEIDNASK